MHLGIIAIALILAVSLRFLLWYSATSWAQRWSCALGAFLVPPLLLMMTAIAMIQMGTEGVMLGIPVGYIGFVIAVGFISGAMMLLTYLGVQGWRSLQQVQRYPRIAIQNHTGRLVDIDIPFAGQVGFWHSELVVSKGLLTVLTPAQVNAVLAHEASHARYRDTFWFFLLGWVRSLTSWLPRTNDLWQELLLLREMRADRQACQFVDPFLLAESLLQVVTLTAQHSIHTCVAFNSPSSITRLEERIGALLEPNHFDNVAGHFIGLQFWIVLMPLLAIAFHH